MFVGICLFICVSAFACLCTRVNVCACECMRVCANHFPHVKGMNNDLKAEFHKIIWKNLEKCDELCQQTILISSSSLRPLSLIKTKIKAIG